MKRQVTWARSARDDLLGLTRYIAAENRAAAQLVYDRINKQAQSLSEFATGRAGRVAGTYEKMVVRAPYILVYAIEAVRGGERITIVRVIHTSRDWPEGAWPAD